MNPITKTFKETLEVYLKLRDTDEILNSQYFDSFGYDIDGYIEYFEDAVLSNDTQEMQVILHNLKQQVEATQKLVAGLKGLNFRYS
jgi:hypothetical protein